MSRARVAEGTWFAVPLDEGYALGLAALVNPPIALGYFFGPRLPEPLASPPSDLSVADAVAVARFTLGGITAGEWPVIGTEFGWSRVAWPMPLFSRFDWLQRRYLLVTYRDDLLTPVSETPLPAGESPELYEEDEIWGDGFVTKRLQSLLS